MNDPRYEIEHKRVHDLEDEVEKLRDRLAHAEREAERLRGYKVADEAEVERLRKRLEIGQNLAGDLSREVKRLQAIIEANDNYDQDATEAEVERLSEADDDARRAHVQLDAALGEIERLRAEREEHWVSRETYDALSAQYDRATAEIERLRAEKERLLEVDREVTRENEQLRNALTSANDDYADSKAEVEQLTALHGEEYEARTAAEVENEQLRAELSKWTVRFPKGVVVTEMECLKLVDEVDRLRTALKRIEDLDWSDGEDAAIKMQVEAGNALAEEKE